MARHVHLWMRSDAEGGPKVIAAGALPPGKSPVVVRVEARSGEIARAVVVRRAALLFELLGIPMEASLAGVPLTDDQEDKVASWRPEDRALVAAVEPVADFNHLRGEAAP